MKIIEATSKYDAPGNTVVENNNQDVNLLMQLEEVTRQRDAAIKRVHLMEVECSDCKRELIAAQMQLSAVQTTNVSLQNARDDLRSRLHAQHLELETATRAFEVERESTRQLREDLAVAINETRIAKAALYRALFAQDSWEVFSGSDILYLVNCCDDIPDVTVDQAILGGGQNGDNALVACMVGSSCDANTIRMIVDELRGDVEGLPMVISGDLSAEYALAIRIYTYGSQHINFYGAVNGAFYANHRSTDSLQAQLPFTKLLIKSLRAYGALYGFVQNVMVFRCCQANTDYLRAVIDNFVTNSADNKLVKGKVMRFPSFTSTSRKLQKHFGQAIIYEIMLEAGHRVGVDVSSLSYVPSEDEVLLIAPSSFRITAAHMDGQTLRISLVSHANSFSYLSKLD